MTKKTKIPHEDMSVAWLVSFGLFTVFALYANNGNSRAVWIVLAVLSIVKAVRHDWQAAQTRKAVEKIDRIQVEANTQPHVSEIGLRYRFEQASQDEPQPKPEPKVWTKQDIIDRFGEDAEITLGKHTFKAKDLNGG